MDKTFYFDNAFQSSSEKIGLKEAKFEDYKLVLKLRNEKIMRKNSFNSKIIFLTHHMEWFKKHWREYKIITIGNKDIGYIRIDNMGFIGIVLFPKYRNMGIGKSILKQIKKGKALIKTSNKQSISCFTKSQFKIKGFYLEKKCQ